MPRRIVAYLSLMQEQRCSLFDRFLFARSNSAVPNYASGVTAATTVSRGQVLTTVPIASDMSFWVYW